MNRDQSSLLQNRSQNLRLTGQTTRQTSLQFGRSRLYWNGSSMVRYLIRGLALGAIALLPAPALSQSPPTEAYPVSTSSPAASRGVPTAPLPIYYNTTLPDVPPLWDLEPFTPEPRTKATHLVLSISQRRVFAYQYDTMLGSFPVAVGKPSTPTPTGEFAIFEMIEDPTWQNPWTGEIRQPGADSALGLRWIGFAELPNGVIGFHGTPTVSSIGQAASNGCVRLRNEDVLALYALVEVGTPVRVEP